MSDTQDVGSKPAVPISILWAGRATTCKGFAEKVFQEAKSHGFAPAKYELSEVVGASQREKLKNGPVVILTCTYDGKPVEMAQNFYEELLTLEGQEWEGINYTVFGSGANVFETIYQRVPRTINERIESLGGQRFYEMGEGDVGVFLYDTWEEWRRKMWDAARQKYQTSYHDTELPKFNVKQMKITERHEILQQTNVKAAMVVENRALTAPGYPTETRHMELRFEEELTYRPGDVVSILPHNAYADIRRVMKRLKIHPLQEIEIDTEFAWMPKNKPILCADLLAKYVDLRYPATRANIRTLLRYVPDSKPEIKEALANWTPESNQFGKDKNLAGTLWKKHITITDFLEEYPDINLPLDEFLRMLQPMRARNYSISSSTLVNPRRLTLTYRVHDFGVCSQFLARLKKDDSLYLSVDPSAHEFHLPSRHDIPLIMFATGTGIAPLRGMLEERAELKKRDPNADIAKSLLFFGCESREKTFLYGDSDFKKWGEVVDVRPAFSWEAGNMHVQDRLWQDRNDVISTYILARLKMGDSDERMILACGHRAAAQGVMEKCVDIVFEVMPLVDKDASVLPEKEKRERAAEIVNQYRNQLYVTDIF